MLEMKEEILQKIMELESELEELEYGSLQYDVADMELQEFCTKLLQQEFCMKLDKQEN